MYVSDGMSASRLLCLPLSWVAMVTSTSLLAFFLYASVPFSPTYTLPLSILHKPLTCMNAETLWEWMQWSLHFLKKWYWASSLLFLAYMHELKTSPGMLPVFPSAGKIKASRIQEGYRKWASERSLFNMYGAQSEGMSTTSTFNHFYGPPFV